MCVCDNSTLNDIWVIFKNTQRNEWEHEWHFIVDDNGYRLRFHHKILCVQQQQQQYALKLVRSMRDFSFFTFIFVYRIMTMMCTMNGERERFSYACVHKHILQQGYFSTVCYWVAVFEHFEYNNALLIISCEWNASLCVWSNENDTATVNWLFVWLYQISFVKWWTYCVIFQCHIANF